MGDLVSLSSWRGKLARRGCLRAVSSAEHYERGLAFEAADQPDAAIAAYRRAVDASTWPDACNNLGRLLHDRDQLGEAESLYRLAICAAGDVGLYWFNLGVVLEDSARCAEAIHAYERALGLEPTLADAHFNLARQLELVGRRGADDLVMRRAVRHLQRYRDLVRTGLG